MFSKKRKSHILPEVSPFVIKYFDLASRHYYESGSLKIGTLEEYRSQENIQTLGARLDSEEGILKVNVSLNNHVISPGEIDEDLGILNNGTGRLIFRGGRTAIRLRHNSYVWCASNGCYSKAQHKRLLQGSKDYSGNPSLLCWATFDAVALDNALKNTLLRPISYDGGFMSYQYCWGHVDYNRDTLERLSDRNHREWISSNEMSEDDYFDAIFAKPNRYALENEIRLAFNPKRDQAVPNGASPIFLSSNEIRDSIIDIGP